MCYLIFYFYKFGTYNVFCIEQQYIVIYIYIYIYIYEKRNLIKKLNYIIIILLYINGGDIIKGFFFL